MKRFLLVSRSLRRLQAHQSSVSIRYLSTVKDNDNCVEGNKVNVKSVSAGLPDFIEDWDRKRFRKMGYGLTALTLVSSLNTFTIFEEQTIFFTTGLGALTGAYWIIGLRDMNQKSQTIRRNFPVLGNARYLLGTYTYTHIHIQTYPLFFFALYTTQHLPFFTF
mmetsp:Transcript_32302/g.37137  ORF Transcript_32302/g.37137 Transcript_32302/m.37137 type:complete len:163 (+) Transcript_32302:121-609(+)